MYFRVANYKITGMRHEIKQFALMLCLLLSATWCCGNDTTEGYSHIQIKESHVQGVPKGNSIQATIEGHVLSVVFLENLGQVSVEVVSAMGWEVTTRVTPTPNGVDIYITNTGSYIVYFTLPNGDVYYGEFEVTD